MSQTITALYDKHADATAAQSKLLALGIPAGSIKLLSGTQTAQTSTTTTGPSRMRASGARSRSSSCRKRIVTPTTRVSAAAAPC